MGIGTTNILERVAASLGVLQSAAPQFEKALDIPYGGLLLALPALMVCGLFSHIKKFFSWPKGYYGMTSIFLIVIFLALARKSSFEKLRYSAPGEWGKLLGLDRCPEVKTLRQKINLLSEQSQTKQWSAQLSADWMNAAPDNSMTLYVDGHVRVYHGHQTPLPKHYVSRERLCLRATTDYWVNGKDSQPYFVINQAVDPGLLHVLEHEIIPRLEEEIPNQPDEKTLIDNPYLHRFTVVFDREGYSPEFMLKMKQKRIACMTYHKYPKEDWGQGEFSLQEVTLASGNRVTLLLAERGTFLGEKIWVKEIRKLNKNGHQTSIISTDYCSEISVSAVTMFARWSQENFFKYMIQHYGLDKIIDYDLNEISDPVKVVNPAYRIANREVRKAIAIRSRKQAEFGALLLDTIDLTEAYQIKKAALQEEIESLARDIQQLKAQRKSLEKHIKISELPDEQKFKQLNNKSKHFIDTIKMIAYRSETAMVNTVREVLSRVDDARSLVQTIFNTEADLVPDYINKTLTVCLHHQANHLQDKVIQHLCDTLNSTEVIFPDTELRLIYKLGSN